MSKSTEIGIEAVKYMLMAQDMDRALSFYRDVMGFTAQFESDHWSELTLGGAVVAIHSGGTGERNPTGLNFYVRDMDEACTRLKAGGGRLVQDPAQREGEPLVLATAADPEGNEFFLVMMTK